MEKIYVIYWSMSGNTQAMAEAIAKGINDSGKEAVVPVSYTHLDVYKRQDMDYVDDDMVDIDAMQKKLSSYKGKTSTASPSPEEWERAFGNDDIIFCITITSGLSGTYNSALAAKGKYESEHKGSRVFIIDSLSTGPEIELIAEKAQELICLLYTSRCV